jgi:hypothetical protein
MSYRLLRFLAGSLNFIGWALVICCTGLGFLPWTLSTIESMPVAPRWQFLVIYGSPVAGFLVGFFAALGFFVLAQLIRVFLDQRDLLEQIVDTNERLLAFAQRPVAAPVPASVPVTTRSGPAAHLEPNGTEEKTL